VLESRCATRKGTVKMTGFMRALSVHTLTDLCFSPPSLVCPHTVTSPAFARSTTAKNMIPMEVMDSVAQSTNMIASASGDFGGYSYPIIGLACLATLILFLSPPLADE
jgi:hypothetical protein